LVRELVNNIQQDTLPADRIWISNSLHGVYFLSERRPAVRYLYFHALTGFGDQCRVDESILSEQSPTPEYLETLETLKQTPPKIIFWTQRASNSCSCSTSESVSKDW
jgi:hypothetical protein